MPRAYHSDRRGLQAEATRRRILQVAAQRFAADGYAATSVRQLATEAGVSVNTLYAVGGKPELFRAALAQVMDDNPQDATLVDHPDLMSLLESADPTMDEVLSLTAELLTAANARAGPMWRAFEEGARTDADLAAAYEQENAYTRTESRRGIERMIDAGICPAQADLARTADLVWAATHPVSYNLLVSGAGWSHAEFRHWLVAHWKHVLLSGALSSQ